MRIARRLLQFALLLATLVVCLVAAALIVSQTPRFHEWLRGFTERQADQYLNGHLSIGKLGGTLLSGVHVRDLTLTVRGEPAIALHDLEIRYDLFQLLARRVVVQSVRLDHPTVRIEREHGRLNLSDLLKPRPRPSRPPGPSSLTVTVNDLTIVGGSIALPATPVGTAGGSTRLPQRIDGIDAHLSFVHAPSGDSVRIDHFSFRGSDPAFDLTDLSGAAAFAKGDLLVRGISIRTGLSWVQVDGAVRRLTHNPVLDLRVDCRPADLGEVGLLLPSVARFHLRPDLHAGVSGPLTAMHLDFTARSGAAGITSGRLVLDARAPDHHLSGAVQLRNFDIYRVFPSALRTDVTGLARIDIGFVKGREGTDVHGTYRLQAPYAEGFGYYGRDLDARGRIDATDITVKARTVGYGSPVTTDGVIHLPHAGRPVGYELRGHATDVDLRALPRSMKLPAVPSDLTFDYHVAGTGSKVQASGYFDRSVLVGATIEPGLTGTISYAGGGSDLGYTADGSVADFDLQRFGREFGIDALTPPRFSSRINAQFRLSASGTTLAALALGATGTAYASRFVGATFDRTSFDVRFVNQSLATRARGQVTSLDPARAIDGAPAANLAGQFDLALGFSRLGAGDATPPLADNLSVSGRVVLGSSHIEGMDIDRAEVNGSYAARSGEIRQLTVAGPTIRATASGRVAFNDRGDSRLEYHLEAADLARVGRLIGQPMSGAATVDGTLTGNGADLQASGTVKARNVAVAGIEALGLDGRYEGQLPHLAPADAVVTTEAQMTFATIAGQRINAIAARTTYAKDLVDFDVEARDPQRDLHVAGEVALRPAVRQLRLRRFSLQSGQATWQLAPGSRPVVEYSADRVGVEDVRLQSGAQEIDARGAIGARASSLDVRASHVALSNIDAVMLADHQLGGVLDGEATITGPREALEATARFSVTRGAFGRFLYQSLGGSLTWRRGRVGVDARLEENPTAWIGVAGSVPVALFGRAVSPAAATEPVDLRITSAPIDLGFVRAFTTTVRDITGVLAIDARIGGTAANPQASGDVLVRNGALTVASTGVRYTNLGARMELRPAGLAIRSLTASDRNGKTLSVSGDLGFGERQVRGVNLRVRADDLKVIDNDLADAGVTADLTVAGEIRQPRVTGTVTIEDGTVNLDKVLEAAFSSPYSTTAEVVQPTVGEATLPPAGLLGSSALDVRVRPNGLVVKGSDIRVGRTSMGFGQVNVTLGGEVHVGKPADGPARFTGTLQTLRGSYQFQGRRFDIKEAGQIGFDGLPRVDPSLNITATRLISGVETRVHIGGRLRKPDLTLSSDPPLDQSDILSLIVFNQPANQLETGQQLSLADRAAAIGSGLIASTVARSVASALRLDTFEIETVENAGQLGAILSVGEQIGPRLYVNVRRGVGPDTTTEFVVDYQLTNFLRFETTMSQSTAPTRTVFRRDQSGADLIFLFSF